MAKKADTDKIKKEIKKMISDITEIPEEKITDDAKFTEDLGIDSMMALEIVANIEKKYKVVIPEEEIPKVNSFKSVYTLLEKLLKKKKK